MADISTDALDAICAAAFDEVDSCILRDGAWTPESLKAWQDECGDDLDRIERVINHVHLRQFFWLSGDGTDEVDAAEVLKVGRRIKTNWTEYLARKFPDKAVVVEFAEDVPEDGWWGGLEVTAYVRRTPSLKA